MLIAIFNWVGFSAFSQSEKSLPIPYSLPSPSGEFKVGTIQFDIADLSRYDSDLNRQGRDIQFQVWYPSLKKNKDELPYIPENLEKAMEEDKYNNIDSVTILEWKELRSHASSNILGVPSRKFPILFFLHGFGISRYSYISIIEDLVSHGFVVISLDSPHSGLVILSDGKVYNTIYNGKPVYKCESMANDVRYAYDWLQKSDDPNLIKMKSSIDFTKAAALGHSLGGAAALEICRIDARFLACIDLDGDPIGNVEQSGLAKPTLILLNEPLLKDEDYTEKGSREKWEQMGAERKKTWQDLFNKNKNIPAFAVRIIATNHYTFTDFPFVTTQYYKQAKPGRTIDKERGLSIISSYIRTFLDRFVSGDHTVAIDNLVNRFPETNMQLEN